MVVALNSSTKSIRSQLHDDECYCWQPPLFHIHLSSWSLWCLHRYYQEKSRAFKSQKMVYLKDWEDFEIAAESMFMQNPGKCRFTLKYMHSKGLLQLKFTDNIKVSTFTRIEFAQCNFFRLFIFWCIIAVHSIQNRDNARSEEDRKADWQLDASHGNK